MKKGATLLEVVLYIACCGLISSLAGHMLLNIHKTARERVRVADTYIALALALQRIVADLQSISGDAVFWKKRASNYVIVKLGEKDCGWLIDKGRLIRVTGSYTTKWADRAVSVLIDSLDGLSFRFCYEQTRLVGLWITVKAKQATQIISLKTFVALKKENA